MTIFCLSGLVSFRRDQRCDEDTSAVRADRRTQLAVVQRNLKLSFEKPLRSIGKSEMFRASGWKATCSDRSGLTLKVPGLHDLLKSFSG